MKLLYSVSVWNTGIPSSSNANINPGSPVAAIPSGDENCSYLPVSSMVHTSVLLLVDPALIAMIWQHLPVDASEYHMPTVISNAL